MNLKPIIEALDRRVLLDAAADPDPRLSMRQLLGDAAMVDVYPLLIVGPSNAGYVVIFQEAAEAQRISSATGGDTDGGYPR